jgi:hypothetical protein
LGVYAAAYADVGGWNGAPSIAAYVAMGVGIPLTIWAWLGNRAFFRERPKSFDERDISAA